LALAEGRSVIKVSDSVQAGGQLGLFEGQIGVWEDQNDPL
jgi:hypothetical protein